MEPKVNPLETQYPCTSLVHNVFIISGELFYPWACMMISMHVLFSAYHIDFCSSSGIPILVISMMSVSWGQAIWDCKKWRKMLKLGARFVLQDDRDVVITVVLATSVLLGLITTAM